MSLKVLLNIIGKRFLFSKKKIIVQNNSKLVQYLFVRNMKETIEFSFGEYFRNLHFLKALSSHNTSIMK